MSQLIMKNYCLTLLILLLITTLATKGSHSQNGENPDSMELALRDMPDDTSKVQLYGQLFFKFEFIDSVKARKYVNLALQLSEKLNHQRGLAQTYMQLGFLHDDIGRYDKALEQYEKSLAIRMELDEPRAIAIMNNNIGIIYKEQGRYPEALARYHKALEIAESKDIYGPMENAYNNIGIIQDDLKNYPEAIKYFTKALEIAKGLDNTIGAAGSYNNLGIIYDKMGDYSNSLVLFQKALDLYDELEYQGPARATAYNNIGFIYYQHLDLEVNPRASFLKSLEYYEMSLKTREQIGDQEGMAVSFMNIGNSYMGLSQYNLALDYLNRALLLANSIGSPYRKKEILQSLASLYESKGNHQKSLKYYKLYTQIEDSLFNEEKRMALAKLEAKHEFESAEAKRKREELATLAATSKAENRRNNLEYSGILIFIVLLFTGVFFLGRMAIPIWLAEGMIFFAFLLFFEFTLVLLDPYIESYSAGAPAMKLAFNATLAAAIFPLHSIFENRLKGRVIK